MFHVISHNTVSEYTYTCTLLIYSLLTETDTDYLILILIMNSVTGIKEFTAEMMFFYF